MSFTIFQREKTHVKVIKTSSPKSRKIHIFPKGLTDGFGPKVAIFSCFFFFGIQARKMSFTIFQSGKKPFQTIITRTSKGEKLTFFYKGLTRSSKGGKIEIFLKGLTHGFRPQMAIFQLFFQAIQARKRSFSIFQSEKTPFQAIKTRSSKHRKIDIFPKGLTHGFGPIMAIFPTFFLKKYRP